MQSCGRAATLLAALTPNTAFVSATCGNGPHSLTPPFTDAHSKDVCKQCVTSADCKWCPLSQSCGTKGLFSKGCMGSRDQDKPVESDADCAGPKPSWMSLLDTKYGKRLEKADSDIMRCLQGRVERWTVWPDTENPHQSEEKVSDYACMSAMLREAVLRSFGGSAAERQEFFLTNATSREVWARRLGNEDGWEMELNIVFCEVFHDFFPNDDCKAWAYGVHEFPALRLRSASPGGSGPSDVSDDIRKSVQSGPLRPHEDFEGFHTTWDYKFTIHMGFDEEKNLKKMVEGQPNRAAVPLREHLKSNKYSLLQRIYSMVFIEIQDIRGYAVLFANEGHGLQLFAKPLHADVVRYDLKGQSRRQTKKQSSATKKVLLNGDFTEREHNKLPFRNWHCKELKKVFRKDVDWLKSHGMAEYSLYVEIAAGRAAGVRVGCGGMPGTPLCNDNEQAVRTSTVSVIDYFKDKLLDRSSNSFGDSMLEFVDEVCLIDQKEKLDSWQIYVVVGCFAALLVGGAAACWFYGAQFLRSNRPHELRSPDASVEMTMRNPGMQPPAQGWPGAMSPGYPAAYPGYPGQYPAYPGAGYPQM